MQIMHECVTLMKAYFKIKLSFTNAAVWKHIMVEKYEYKL